MHYDIFISYRREGGFETAALLCGRLKDVGYRVFFDVETLRSGRFNEALYLEIEQCQDFIVVLTPGSLDRCYNAEDWVRLEIAHALKTKKNIIPILTRGFEWPHDLPSDIDEVRYCNGVTPNQEYFDATLEKLRTFLHSSTVLWRRKLMKWSVGLMLLLSVLLATAYRFRGQISSHEAPRFPSTQEERGLVNQVLYYVRTHMQVANEAYRLFDAFLTDAEAISEPTQPAFAQLKQLSEHTLKQLDTLVERVKPLDSGAISALRKTAVPMEDVLSFAEIPQNTSNEIRTSLEMICRTFDPQAPFDAQARKKLLTAYRKWNDASARGLWYGMCELLLSIDSASLDDFRQQWIPRLDFFQPLRGQWSRDLAECKSQQELALQILQETDTDIASVLGGLAQRNVEAERQQKAALDQLNAVVSQCDVQYAQEMKQLEDSLPAAISNEFLSVWSSQSVLAYDARSKHAALIAERVTGELLPAFKARTTWGMKTIPVVLDTVACAGGTSNQLAYAESVKNRFTELATAEQWLLDRLAVWKDTRSAEAADCVFKSIMIAKEKVDVKLQLARLSLCQLAWAINHPQKESLLRAHNGFENLTPETVTQVEKAFLDQWASLNEASSAYLEQRKKQDETLNQRLAAAYERLAKKATVMDADTPGVIWNKALIFLRVDRKEEALAAFDVFLQKQRVADPDDKGVDRYVAVTRAYIQQRYPVGYVGGALVVGFADNKLHSSLKIGDIVQFIDGHAVMTSDDFLTLKKERSGQAIPMRILRMKEYGTLSEMEVIHLASDPLIGVASLKYVTE